MSSGASDYATRSDSLIAAVVKLGLTKKQLEDIGYVDAYDDLAPVLERCVRENLTGDQVLAEVQKFRIQRLREERCSVEEEERAQLATLIEKYGVARSGDIKTDAIIPPVDWSDPLRRNGDA